MFVLMWKQIVPDAWGRNSATPRSSESVVLLVMTLGAYTFELGGPPCSIFIRDLGGGVASLECHRWLSRQASLPPSLRATNPGGMQMHRLRFHYDGVWNDDLMCASSFRIRPRHRENLDRERERAHIHFLVWPTHAIYSIH